MIRKGQNPSRIGRWTYTTILGQKLKRTTQLNSIGHNTVLMQQSLVMKKTQSSQHPHEVAINDLIKDVKENYHHSHEIMTTMDDNESFENSKGSIAKLCRSYKLHDIIGHMYGHSDIPNP